MDFKTFVYIGANDGSNPIIDKLLNDGATGVLFEPQPEQFKSLCDKYAYETRLVIIDAAVCEETGRTSIYGHPNDGYGTTTSNHGSSLHPIPGCLFSYLVNTLSYDLLVRSFDVPDLLIVDTEGYDSDIVCAIIERDWKPRCIITANMSHHHYIPNAPQLESKKRNVLEQNGYTLTNVDHDHNYTYELS